MGTGGEGASMTSRMFFGGWLYPDAPSFGATVAEVTLEEDEFDCARMGTIAQATSAPTKKQSNPFRAGMVPSASMH
jgi:hypothetical protein